MGNFKISRDEVKEIMEQNERIIKLLNLMCEVDTRVHDTLGLLAEICAFPRAICCDGE